MNTVIDGLRQILGVPSFTLADCSWNYGAIIEYFVGAVVLCIVITSVFRFLGKLVSR